jgi:hypothetical protein
MAAFSDSTILGSAASAAATPCGSTAMTVVAFSARYGGDGLFRGGNVRVVRSPRQEDRTLPWKSPAGERTKLVLEGIERLIWNLEAEKREFHPESR